jgi:hypothetical protein
MDGWGDFRIASLQPAKQLGKGIRYLMVAEKTDYHNRWVIVELNIKSPIRILPGDTSNGFCQYD